VQEDRLVLTVGANRQSWARVVLVGSRPPAGRWHIDSSQGPICMLVGSGPRCSWQIRRPGVAIAHAGLYWDGHRLWIADVHGVGGVAVDGVPVRAWQPIAGRVRIDIGTAVMVAETSFQPDPLPFGGPPPMPAEEDDPLAATVIAPFHQAQRPQVTPTPVPPSPPAQAAARFLARRRRVPVRTWALLATTVTTFLLVLFLTGERPAASSRMPRARPRAAAPAGTLADRAADAASRDLKERLDCSARGVRPPGCAP
jgi:hypothetical protein